jgi:hypothetical protein
MLARDPIMVTISRMVENINTAIRLLRMFEEPVFFSMIVYDLLLKNSGMFYW